MFDGAAEDLASGEIPQIANVQMRDEVGGLEACKVVKATRIKERGGGGSKRPLKRSKVSLEISASMQRSKEQRCQEQMSSVTPVPIFQRRVNHCEVTKIAVIRAPADLPCQQGFYESSSFGGSVDAAGAALETLGKPLEHHTRRFSQPAW